MVRVFPIVTVGNNVPGFSSENNEIFADKGTPVVAVDSGTVVDHISVVRLSASDGEVYDYGGIVPKHKKLTAVIAGEIIGKVKDNKITFTSYKYGNLFNPYNQLIIASNIFLPDNAFWWRKVARAAIVAAAGLGVGVILTSVYYVHKGNAVHPKSSIHRRRHDRWRRKPVNGTGTHSIDYRVGTDSRIGRIPNLPCLPEAPAAADNTTLVGGSADLSNNRSVRDAHRNNSSVKRKGIKVEDLIIGKV